MREQLVAALLDCSASEEYREEQLAENRITMVCPKANGLLIINAIDTHATGKLGIKTVIGSQLGECASGTSELKILYVYDTH